MFISTIREFGACVEEEWTRETCQKVSCSPQGLMVITKIREVGNNIERITKNCIMLSKCFPVWRSEEVNCSLTKNGKQMKMLVMYPKFKRNGAIVAFADSEC
uniref:Phlebovirus_G2 domain-containing protein n=1 Tax=Ascaris lumbricoides TaxID=6252 RepID=A0A0M3ICF4_ASCLU